MVPGVAAQGRDVAIIHPGMSGRHQTRCLSSALRVHFVDDKWRLRSLVLGFEPLEGSHTGSTSWRFSKTCSAGESGTRVPSACSL